MNNWILLGIILLALELLSFSFFLVFFGLGALLVALILVFYPLSLAWQILIFSVSSTLFFLIGKLIIKKYRHENALDQDDMVNKIAIALEDAEAGAYLKVMIGDTVWKAHTEAPIRKGQQAKVKSIDNLTAEIKPL